MIKIPKAQCALGIYNIQINDIIDNIKQYMESYLYYLLYVRNNTDQDELIQIKGG